MWDLGLYCGKLLVMNSCIYEYFLPTAISLEGPVWVLSTSGRHASILYCCMFGEKTPILAACEWTRVYYMYTDCSVDYCKYIYYY